MRRVRFGILHTLIAGLLAAALPLHAASAEMMPILLYLLETDSQQSSSASESSEASSSSAASEQSSVAGGSSSSAATDPKYTYEYEGMRLYATDLPRDDYRLTPLGDEAFGTLSLAQKRLVADKLLATLYYGVPTETLEAMITGDTFISDVWAMIHTATNDLGAAETRLNDNGDEDEEFYFWTWPDGIEEVSKILARFYVLEDLDSHYVDFWSSYVLTSTIMFSPAYELESSHAPNIDRVYGALVRNQRDECSMAYLTFLHMVSDDNWRRFRSPEDNGREMMEIFLLDFDDAHVPIAAQALKNWKLDRDYDTLVIGLDDNTEPLSLFGTTIVDGFGFYRELAKSADFVPGAASRLVDLYFPTYTAAQKQAIVASLDASGPKTWRDLLLQIVFSEEYLLRSDKPKSAEELFFSQSKKLHFSHRRGFFSDFARALESMHQAPMKYKLGKYTEVPLDTQSFLTYHKSIREGLMIRSRNEWYSGWVDSALLYDQIFAGISAYEYGRMVDRLVDHLFLSVVARTATEEEKTFFKSHFLDENGMYKYEFELFQTGDDPLEDRRHAAIAILDYLSRLAEFYRFAKVQP